MNFLIVGGHQGTTGAVSNGYKEEDIVKKIADKVVFYLKEQGHQAEEPNYNLYDKIEKEGVGKDLRVYNHILEIHLNSAQGARGTEIFVSTKTEGTSVEKAIMARLGKWFINRGVKREDFYILYKLEEAGRNVSLLEVCFESSKEDMDILMKNFDEICKDIAYGLLEGYEEPIKVIQKSTDATSAPYGKIYAVRVGSAKVRGNAEEIRDRAIRAGFSGAYLELVPYSKEK